MKLEVLGCYGNVTERCRTSAFLINDRVLFDAGTVTEVLSLERLRGISHVCLSHIHLDHVKGLCSLAEELSMVEGQRLTVAADEQVIEALSKHVFNNLLWPDFTAIPDKERGVIRPQAMDHNYADIAGLRVKPVPVNHRIYTTAFIIKEDAKTIMMTSDTGMTEQFWEAAKGEEHVEFIIVHVAFPNRLFNLASMAGHMTLSVLLDRIDTYRLHHIPFYVAHMKSMFEEEVRGEIKEANRQNIRVLEQGSFLFA
jgi:3',5'-cyclic-nucleotide phosphodiesterase